ncbi:MAG: YcgL domain-containing protein [Gammaproteobacteria bacterium]|nr:YcgL domain-containing protein [Gammaproteobacteria bacterium]
MNCIIYKSNKKEGLYLYVLKEDDFSDVPESLMQNFGEPEFVMELELDSNRKLARADTSDVLQGLSSQGYYLQVPPTIVSLLNNT